jgi:predicted nucleotidyltransferase
MSDVCPDIDSHAPARGPDFVDHGLDVDGRIRREGDLDLVDVVFLPLLATTEMALKELLGPRLHSIYLYGSVPRGTAVPGRSDLDVSVVLHNDPTDAERAEMEFLARELEQESDSVVDVGLIVDGRDQLLSPVQRYDGAFHISCLCTPLWGPDLGVELPNQYPSVELARGIPGDTGAVFTRLAAALDDAATPRLDLVRQRVGRRIARLAFACVMFRWPGWTSDPQVIRRVVKDFYPDRVGELDVSIRLGWGRLNDRPPITAPDHEDARHLLLTSAPWWRLEHDRVTRT